MGTRLSPPFRLLLVFLSPLLLILSARVMARPFAGEATEQASFKSSTALLTIEVAVLDHDGSSVEGLTVDDFVAQINGKPQIVRAVNFVHSGATNPETTSVVDALRASSIPVGNREPRTFVLLLDDISIRSAVGKGLIVGAEKFVEGLPSTDLVGLATTSGLTVVNPSFDRTELMNKLRRSFGGGTDFRDVTGPFVGVNEALRIDDGMKGVLVDVISRECSVSPAQLRFIEKLIADNDCAQEVDQRARTTATLAKRDAAEQLLALRSTIQAMGAAGGIKQLVIVTAGIGIGHNVVDFLPIAKAAAANGVQISALAEEPEDTDMSLKGGRARAADQRALQASFQTMTEMSGGQFFRVIGQPTRFYERIQRSAAGVYRIGIELPPGLAADADLNVAVQVSRSNVTVHASRVAALPVGKAVGSAKDQVRRAVATGDVLYGLPIRIATASQSTGDKITLRVLIESPAIGGIPDECAFGIVDAAGGLRSGSCTFDRKVTAGQYRVEIFVPVDTGDYRVRVAVSQGGKIGSLEQKLAVKK